MNSSNRKSIFESKIFVTILLMILLKPAYIGTIGVISKAINFSCIIIAIFLVFYAVFGIHVSKELVWVLAYYGVIALSTIINSGNLTVFVKDNIFGFSLCVLFIICMEKSPLCLFESFNYALIYFFINLITVFLYPRGMYKTTLYRQNWFLGYKNPQIRLILAFLCMFFLLSVIRNKKISIFNYIVLGLSILTAIKVKSINGIVGIVAWSILILLAVFVPIIYKIINLTTVFWGYIAFMAFLFFVNIPQLVFDILLRINKRKSFLGRYQLWKKIIGWINKKMFLGYGYLSGTDFLAYTNKWWATHAHNWALNIMMLGGIVLLIIFSCAVLASAKDLNRYNGSMCGMIISATLITFFLMGIDEAMTNSPMIYPILILAMNIDRIIELYREEKYTRSLFGIKYSFTR